MHERDGEPCQRLRPSYLARDGSGVCMHPAGGNSLVVVSSGRDLSRLVDPSTVRGCDRSGVASAVPRGGVSLCAMIPAMTDRPPTADQQVTGSRDSRDLSVAEAADRLGLTPDAVRGRLHRGTLYGQKMGTEWRVFLPEEEAPRGRRQATQQLPTVDQQDAAADRQATDRADEGSLVALVADLARRNEELAAAAAMWQARASHLEDRLLALGAGQDAPSAAPAVHHATETTDAAADTSLPWWRFWERWR